MDAVDARRVREAGGGSMASPRAFWPGLITVCPSRGVSLSPAPVGVLELVPRTAHAPLVTEGMHPPAEGLPFTYFYNLETDR